MAVVGQQLVVGPLAGVGAVAGGVHHNAPQTAAARGGRPAADVVQRCQRRRQRLEVLRCHPAIVVDRDLAVGVSQRLGDERVGRGRRSEANSRQGSPRGHAGDARRIVLARSGDPGHRAAVVVAGARRGIEVVIVEVPAQSVQHIRRQIAVGRFKPVVDDADHHSVAADRRSIQRGQVPRGGDVHARGRPV